MPRLFVPRYKYRGNNRASSDKRRTCSTPTASEDVHAAAAAAAAAEAESGGGAAAAAVSAFLAWVIRSPCLRHCVHGAPIGGGGGGGGGEAHDHAGQVRGAAHRPRRLRAGAMRPGDAWPSPVCLRPGRRTNLPASQAVVPLSSAPSVRAGGRAGRLAGCAEHAECHGAVCLAGSAVWRWPFFDWLSMAPRPPHGRRTGVPPPTTRTRSRPTSRSR
jgi:hypothetical protein